MSIHELQAALRALDEARRGPISLDAGRLLDDLEAAARRVAEGAGEPVQWQWFDEAEDDWLPVLTEGEAAHRRMKGQRVRELFTAPPSAGIEPARENPYAKAQQAAQVPVAVVREYVEARFALEVAQSPPIFGGRPRRLRHNDERMVRVRRALGELEAAARGQAAQVPVALPASPAEWSLERARAFLPEGYRLVPVEPTEAMLDVMHERVRILCNPAEKSASIRNDREVWVAMLAAAQAQGVGRG